MAKILYMSGAIATRWAAFGGYNWVGYKMRLYRAYFAAGHQTAYRYY